MSRADARTLRYQLVDVFTDRAFAGNALAVFAQPPELSAAEMQAIARELNLSETTFVYPPTRADCDVAVRIFTPRVELPMAGHPTLGTAWVLARERGWVEAPTAVDGDGPPRRVLEEGVGPVPVEFECDADGEMRSVAMVAPECRVEERYADKALLARLLDIEPHQLAAAPEPRIASGGHPFLFVAVRDRAALTAVRLRPDVYEERFRGTPAEKIFAFVPPDVDSSPRVAGRMFAPALGVPEDPATGSAVGPLATYLESEGLLGTRPTRLIVSQGDDMGRPSELVVELEPDELKVRGRVVEVGRGTLVAIPGR